MELGGYGTIKTYTGRPEWGQCNCRTRVCAKHPARPLRWLAARGRAIYARQSSDLLYRAVADRVMQPTIAQRDRKSVV